jgi:hypothetical protein
LQQALEAWEHINKYGFVLADYEGPMEQAITTLKAALEQPEQEREPVEIKPPNPEGATQCIVRWFAETPAGWVGAWDREALEQFAHPPRREWRSLSEEEIQSIHDTYHKRMGPQEFARAVEAALKEKNND